MRKRSYYALVVFLVVMGLLPLLEGMIFKKNYFQLISVINKDSRFKIEVLEYHRGWFESHSRIHVTLNKTFTDFYRLAFKMGITQNPIDFDINENIGHGPIIYDPIAKTIEFGNAKIQSYFYLPEELTTALSVDERKNAFIQLGILSEFLDNWTVQFYIPALSFPYQETGKITWGGLSGNLRLGLRGNQLKFVNSEMKIAAINLQNDAKNNSLKQLVIQPITYQYDVSKSDGLFSGNTNLYTDNITMTTANNAIVITDKFNIHTAFSLDQQSFYNANITINTKNIKTSNQSIPAISSIEMMLSASNFSVQGLLKYINDNKATGVQQVDLKNLEALLVNIITPESTVNGSAELKTALGALTCHYKSTWRADVPAPTLFSDVISSADTKFNFIVSPSVATKLIELYDGEILINNNPDKKGIIIKHDNEDKANEAANNAQNSGNPPSKTETPQELLDDLVLGGFINKDDNNNYITSLTIQSQVWKMNDRPVRSK